MSPPASSLQPILPVDLAKNDPAFGLPGSRLGALVQSYFRSGWAFLISLPGDGPDKYRVGSQPTTVHAWLKWPVNPAPGGEGLVKGMSESAGALPSTAWSSPPFTFTLTSLVPPLLHVYWFLHALHLILGADAPVLDAFIAETVV